MSEPVMKVLWIHEPRPHSGEDPVVSSQATLLRANGVEVLELQLGHCGQGGAEAWSEAAYARVRDLCAEQRPSVAHVHNCWNRLSPSVHAACHDAGVATVQSLYDFRLLCLNGLFVRDGRDCQDCLGKSLWQGVKHRCGGSLVSSIRAAKAIEANRKRGTWKRDVDAYIVSNQLCWEQFVYGGIPPTRMFVRPPFTGDPGDPPTLPSESDVVFYYGQLRSAPDLELLLGAWKRANLSRVGRLLIAGVGPERSRLEAAMTGLGLSPAAVMFAGNLNPAETLRLMWDARLVVAPSNPGVLSGKVAVKALSCGRPVLCSESSDAASLVQAGSCGFRFKPGDVAGLADVLEFALMDDTIADCMGEIARAEYLAKYSPPQNFRIMMRVYRSAIGRRGGELPSELLDFEPAETLI